jgi:hypothetical protein
VACGSVLSRPDLKDDGEVKCSGTPWRIGHVHSFQCTSSFKVHRMYNAPEAPSPEGMQLDGGTRTPNTRFLIRRIVKKSLSER